MFNLTYKHILIFLMYFHVEVFPIETILPNIISHVLTPVVSCWANLYAKISKGYCSPQSFFWIEMNNIFSIVLFALSSRVSDWGLYGEELVFSIPTNLHISLNTSDSNEPSLITCTYLHVFSKNIKSVFGSTNAASHLETSSNNQPWVIHSDFTAKYKTRDLLSLNP